MVETTTRAITVQQVSLPISGMRKGHSKVDFKLWLERQRKVGKTEAIQVKDTCESKSVGWRYKEGMLAEEKQ